MNGVLHLPWVTGPRRAKQILFTNRPLSAEQALDFGMVSEVVPADQLKRLGYHGAQRHGEEDDDDPTTVEGKRIGLIGEALEARRGEGGPVRPDEAGSTQSRAAARGFAVRIAALILAVAVFRAPITKRDVPPSRSTTRTVFSRPPPTKARSRSPRSALQVLPKKILDSILFGTKINRRLVRNRPPPTGQTLPLKRFARSSQRTDSPSSKSGSGTLRPSFRPARPSDLSDESAIHRMMTAAGPDREAAPFDGRDRH
jgi:hypothetical protein